jgi:hypothetical protein
VKLSEASDQDPTEREGVLTVARVSDESPARLRPGVDRRRCSEGFWSTAMTRRCSERHDGLEGLGGVVDCVLWRGWRAAGDVQGGRSFGFVMSSLIPCERNGTEGMRGVRHSRIKGMGWVRECLVHRRRRILPEKPADERTSDEELVQPCGAIGGGERGNGRGGRDHLIGAERDRNGQGV